MRTLITLMIFLLYCSIVSANQNDSLHLVIQDGHKTNLNSVDLSPDGTIILTTASEKNNSTIKFWNTKGCLLNSQIFNSTSINAYFSPNGKYIVVGGMDGHEVYILDYNGNIKNSYKTKDGWNKIIRFAPDSRYIYSTGNSSTAVYKYDIVSKTIRTISQNGEETNCIDISKDGKLLAVGYNNGKVRIFDTDSILRIEKVVSDKQLDGKDSYISALKFSPDGKSLLCGSNDKILRKLDVNLNLIWGKKGFRYAISLLDFDLKNNIVVEINSVFYNKHQMQIYDQDANYIKEISFSDGSHIEVNEICFDRVNKIAYSAIKVLGKREKMQLDAPKKNFGIISWDKDWNQINFYPFLNLNYVDNISCCSTNSGFVVGYTNEDLSEIKIWDPINGLRSHDYWIGIKNLPLCKFSISPDDQKIITFDGRYVNISSTKTGKVLKYIPNDTIYEAAWSPDGKYLAFGGSDKPFYVLDSSYYLTFDHPLEDMKVLSLSFSKDGEKLAIQDLNVFRVYDLKGKKVFEVKAIANDSFVRIRYSPDGKFLCLGAKGRIDFYDANSFKLLRTLSAPTTENFVISKDQKYIATKGTDAGTINLYGFTGEFIKTLKGSGFDITDMDFSNDNKYLISISIDKQINVWNLKTYDYVQYVSMGDDWIIFTPDGYWDSSIKGANLLAMAKGNNGFGIDQFAAIYNRPDTILYRLGFEDKSLINLMNRQYKKRLKKLGVNAKKANSDVSLPATTILGTKIEGNNITINLKFSDNKVNLKRYNIFVNDVPLFGSDGKPLTGKLAAINEKFQLTYGRNKIEASCININGTESFRVLTFADNNIITGKDVYILAFGVSKYKNAAYNLAYAAKDAIDLTIYSKEFKHRGFEHVYTKVLTDEQVIPDSIKAAKAFVKNAKVDDIFILFIAGHGMHDSDADATYYYLTYNADVNNLKGTAANFETIEDLLQGIPPRNKLFLMDACESGEIDEEDQGQMLAAASGAGIASRGFKKMGTEPVEVAGAGTSRTSVPPKRGYLYQKDRYIYNDITRRSGAIVFSSSKGGELSYERSDIENGLFTEYIMRGLYETGGFNGYINTDGLRDFVSKHVAEASNGLQHPTVDRDNIYQKFEFGVRSNSANPDKQDQSVDFNKQEQKSNCVYGNCNTGIGQMVWADSSFYIGEFENGQPKGIGVFRSSKKYIWGEFDGKRLNGYGGMVKIDTSEVTIGNWLNGKRQGTEYMYNKDKNRWQVEWFENDVLMHRISFQSGKQRHNIYWDMMGIPQKDGSCYYGDLVDEDPNDYVDEIPKGYGFFLWNDGRIFKGQFDNGKPNGYGIYFLDKFRFFEGDVINGELLKGKMIFPPNENDGIKYIDGNFKQGIMSNGTVFFKNGDKYTGSVKDNIIPHGEGTMKYSSGQVKSGNWVDGKLN
jgi:WD40 repeat protein